MKLTGTGVISIVGLVVAGVGAAFLYKEYKKHADAFNPTSDKNIAYQAANKILQTITGNKIDSVGTAVANNFPSAAEKAVNEMLKPIVLKARPGYYDLGAKLPAVSNTPAEDLLTAQAQIVYGLGKLGRWM